MLLSYSSSLDECVAIESIKHDFVDDDDDDVVIFVFLAARIDAINVVRVECAIVKQFVIRPNVD